MAGIFEDYQLDEPQSVKEICEEFGIELGEERESSLPKN